MREFVLVVIILSSFKSGAQDVSVLNESARRFASKGDLKAATEILDKSIKSDPNNSETYTTYGIIYLNEGLFKKAEPWFKRAIQIDSRNLQAYDGLSLIYSETKNYKQALEMFDRSIDIDPTVFRYTGRAYLFGFTGNFKKVIDDANSILELDSLNADAYWLRGNANYFLKSEDRGCPDLKRSIELGRIKDEFYVLKCEK